MSGAARSECGSAGRVQGGIGNSCSFNGLIDGATNMSFYIRKSVSFGPLRVNLSKSGIGLSAGVRGARISTGPRGTYINMGRNGLYYRQRIDGSIEGHNYRNPSVRSEPPEEESSRIRTASAAELTDSSNSKMLAEINASIQQTTLSTGIILAGTAIAGLLALYGYTILPKEPPYLYFPPAPGVVVLGIAAMLWLVAFAVSWVTHKQEQLARTTTLHYKLDDSSSASYSLMQSRFEKLMQSSRLWRVTSKYPNSDWKRNAGASDLVLRSPIRIQQQSPPFLDIALNPYCIALDNMQLFFMPDQVFAYQSGKYGAVGYNSLQIQASPARFIEKEGVPPDSRVLSYTWQYIRKDGGPDRRFANNRQIPVMEYGLLEFTSPSGLNLFLYISNLTAATQFAESFRAYSRSTAGSTGQTSSGFKSQPAGGSPRANEKQKSEPKAKSGAKTDPTDALRSDSPYAILQVSPDASDKEITDAYHHMAQLYHPDKVAGLGPELQEVAQRKMKEINAAYEQLSRRSK
jgi:DnaJ-domain-containing protein 1